MKNDISHVLSGWPYEENAGLQVRRVDGENGREKVQLRIDLGLMQMEVNGRPDGARPHGQPSLLEFLRTKAGEHRRKHGWYEGFKLAPEDLQLKLDARYHVGHRQRLRILLDDALRREDPEVTAELRPQLRSLKAGE